MNEVIIKRILIVCAFVLFVDGIFIIHFYIKQGNRPQTREIMESAVTWALNNRN